MRWITVAALLLGACSKSDDGPACGAVVDNMIAVTKQMTNHGGMELQNRKAMIAQCEQRKMSPEHRRCLVAAKDLTAIAGCTKPPAAK